MDSRYVDFGYIEMDAGYMGMDSGFMKMDSVDSVYTVYSALSLA